MPPKPKPLFLEVIDYEAYVELKPKPPSSDKVVGYTKREGTEAAFLHLRAPDGTTVRAEISYERLDDIFSLMFPEDYYPSAANSNRVP